MCCFPKWTGLLTSMALLVAASTSQAAEKDIVDTAVGAGSFKTLASALQAADLVDALKGDGPFTVFAPTDAAFSKLPQGTVETLLKPENKQQLVDVLTYHVAKGKVPASQVVKLTGVKSLNGQQIDIKAADGHVTVDSAKVIKADIMCSNGVIHVIDEVILPATKTIPETAAEAGNFKTLIAAVKAAGLAEALSGKGPFTVFAPTDAAFAKLPAGTVKTLLKPENKSKLADILKYHVVPGRVYSTDALAAGKAKTLLGDSISIKVEGKTAMVNDAKLIATDLDASNGVIHVIDSVILPPEKNAAAIHPRRMIEKAVEQGAPLYNSGHHDACAKVYSKTIEDLLSAQSHGMCPSTTHTLQAALTSSQQTNCSATRAWTLRRALDVAYQQSSATR